MEKLSLLKLPNKVCHFLSHNMGEELKNKLEQINHLKNCGELTEALFIADSILEHDATNEKTLGHKISILGLLNKYEDSIKIADFAIDLYPSNHLFHFMRGITLYHSSKFNDALESFESCLKINPKHHRALGKKISTLILLRRYKEAIELYELSDLDEDSYKQEFNNIGYAYFEVGDYKKAELYLNAAFDNSRHPVTIYNLARLYRKKKNYSRYLRYLILLRINTISNYKKSNTSQKWDIDKFHGPGKLFKTNSQIRETKAILKIFRTPNWAALCNDTFNWFAFNIPMDLLRNNSFKGDIDIIVSMPGSFPPNLETPPKYRCFEVKSILVKKDGEAKSLKRGKHKKVRSQLNKLIKFGSHQVILLEIYALERGFSNNLSFPTEEISREITTKANLLKNNKVGYLIITDEATDNIQDSFGGKYSFPDNILVGPPHEISKPFSDLANYLDTFYKEESHKLSVEGFSAITFCNKCKELVLFPVHSDTLICYKCKNKIF